MPDSNDYVMPAEYAEGYCMEVRQSKTTHCIPTASIVLS